MGDEMGSKETARLWDVRPVTVWPFSSPSDANQVVSIKRQAKERKKMQLHFENRSKGATYNCPWLLFPLEFDDWTQ